MAGKLTDELAVAVRDTTKRFYNAMDDDFDSPSAIAALFDSRANDQPSQS
ncbi:MAG: DALR domain-containing protein [Thermomicrobiales bacterium]